MSAFTRASAFCDRIGPLGAALDDVDAQDGDVGAELEMEILAVLGRDDHEQLLDVVAVQELSAECSQTALLASGANGFL